MITIRFVMLGLCVWLATSMASGRGATNPIARVLRGLGWCLMAAGMLGMLVGFWSPLGLMLSLPLGAVLLFATINYSRRRCQSLQDTLLGLITLSTRRGIPLAGLVDAFAHDAPTWAVWPATSLARKLHEGLDLAQAAQGTLLLIPRQAVMAIRVGQQLGELAPCLDLYARANREAREADHRLSSIMGYLLLVLMTTVATGFVQAFYVWKIAPEFVKIFDDFGLQTPAVTSAFAETMDYAYLFFIPLLTVSALLTMLVGIAWMMHLAGGLGWLPAPRLASLQSGTDTAFVLQLLGLAIERDRDIAAALLALSQTHPQPSLRKGLRLASLDIRLGLPTWISLAKYRLVRNRDLPLLESAERAGNLPWALRELANRNARRTHQKTALALRSLTAVCFTLIAVQVLFYAVAGFAPLAALIESLT